MRNFERLLLNNVSLEESVMLLNRAAKRMFPQAMLKRTYAGYKRGNKRPKLVRKAA